MYLVPWPFFNLDIIWEIFSGFSMPLLFDWLRIVYQSNSTSLGLCGKDEDRFQPGSTTWVRLIHNKYPAGENISCNFKDFSFTSFHTPFFFWYTPLSPIWEPSDWCDCFWVRHQGCKAAPISPPYKSQMWREANNTLASHHNVKQIIDHNIWRVVCTKKQKKKPTVGHSSSFITMKSLKCSKNKSWGGTTASGWLSITFATLASSHERYDDHTPATYSVITVTYSVITVCPFQQRPHMLHHCQLSKPEKERMQKRGV